MFGNNGWYANGASDYLKLAEAVNITGTLGKVYVVSVSKMYGFKSIRFIQMYK